MRSIKMFSLAVVAAGASMAFVGVSSALATGSTAICETHTSAACASPVSLVTFHQSGTGTLVAGSITVLCLSGTFGGHVESEASPLGIEVLTLEFSQCGTNKAHNNCIVITTVKGLLDIARSELNLGTATSLGTKVLVECSGLHCVYGGPEAIGFTLEGALHTEGAGKGLFIAKNLKLPQVEGLFCPSESHWTAKFEPLVHLYLLK